MFFMGKDNGGFGLEKRKSLYEQYIGRWVIIYPVGVHVNFAGKVTDVKEGYAVLNPFQSEDVEEGTLVRKLVTDETGSLAPLEGSGIKPTSERYLRAYCELANKKDLEEEKNRDGDKK